MGMPRVPPQERIEEFERLCRGHGLPLTVQRRTVFEAILDMEDHPTADQIYDRIKNRVPGISRTTVYRILDTLVRIGVIRRICHHMAAARFDPKTYQHHHLVCMHCEQIIDIEDQRLNRIEAPDVRRYGFKISDYHIHFQGICSRCRSKMEKGGDAAGKAKVRLVGRAATRKQQSNKKRSKKT